MSRKNTNQPEYGTGLKLAAVRRVLAGESAIPNEKSQSRTPLPAML